MKHPVSVAELLELHRLGDLYLKWTATPFAMSEEDLQELQEISDRYHINHSSALFSFQKKYQQEMAVHIEQQLDRAIEALPGLEAALAMVSKEPMFVNDSDGAVKPTAFSEAPEEDEAELDGLLQADAALREQLHEDNEVDREAEAQYRADQLREAMLEEQLETEREIEILKQISNVDELTSAESARLDELISQKTSAMNSGTHKIPVGVVQDAITTGHIEKVK